MIMARIVNTVVRTEMLINMSKNIGIRTIRARKPNTDIDTPKHLNQDKDNKLNFKSYNN